MKECLWVFGETSSDVAGASGAVSASAKITKRKITFTGTATDPMSLFAPPDGPPGANPRIERPLPGTSKSLFDELGDCSL